MAAIHDAKALAMETWKAIQSYLAGQTVIDCKNSVKQYAN